jgi:parallel beta-helix repeat protein
MTIQDAIDSARQGDIIRIPAGIYYEHVVVNKTITLAGSGVNGTVVDGSNNGTIITVTANNVTITGFTLRNSGYGWTMQGVYVYNADDCNVTGNTFYNVCHNIRLNYSRNSLVLENTIESPPGGGVTMYGIRIENSLNCTVSDNSVSVRVGAIHLENATGCIVIRNRLFNSDQGIRLYSPCTQNVIDENMVFDNRYDGMIAAMPGGTDFTGNRIFHNNFVNNTNPFIVQLTGTLWDDGLEGNYWSRHQNSDFNNDGITDSTYTFGTEHDNCPLAGQFSSFSAVDSQTVNMISDSIVEGFTCSVTNATISIYVSNATSTQETGFCRVKIPHSLMNESYSVTVDGEAPLFANYTLHDDGSSRWIYVRYPLTQHEILIVSEFSSSMLQITIVMMLCAVLTAFFSKKRLWAQ